MPRKSSRLAAKKRVNYNEDALWYRALGKGKEAWNEMIEVVADDPPPVKKPWQKKKPKKLFQKKKLFRKKPPKVKKVLKRGYYRKGRGGDRLPGHPRATRRSHTQGPRQEGQGRFTAHTGPQPETEAPVVYEPG